MSITVQQLLQILPKHPPPAPPPPPPPPPPPRPGGGFLFLS
nr:hypothetical protein [Pseudomonas savastanoi]